jgi:hypothetical protein
LISINDFDKSKNKRKDSKMVEGSQRKTRSDKGSIQATVRDLHVLEWISHQYVARLDHVQQLLSREPGAPMTGKQLAMTTVRDQLDRWRRAGWVEYKRVLADEPGWVWVTRKGLQLVGLDERYSAREPAATRLHHLYSINSVRLIFESRKYSWTSERWVKSESKEKEREGRAIPDGVLHKDGRRIAIEVELTLKKPQELWLKVLRLADTKEWASLERAYHSIWFYVASKQIQAALQEQIGRLPAADQQRFAVSVVDWL